MSVEIIRAKILEILQGISIDIGNNIYDYRRHAARMDDYFNLFKDGNKILGWEFYRASTALSTDFARTTSINYESHAWFIHGIMSVDDSSASEKLFDSKIEKIRDTFRSKIDLDGVAFEISPMVLTNSTHMMSSLVLCHSCELSFSTTEEVQWR